LVQQPQQISKALITANRVATPEDLGMAIDFEAAK
jgi:hypothetical protein